MWFVVSNDRPFTLDFFGFDNMFHARLCFPSNLFRHFKYYQHILHPSPMWLGSSLIGSFWFPIRMLGYHCLTVTMILPQSMENLCASNVRCIHFTRLPKHPSYDQMKNTSNRLLHIHQRAPAFFNKTNAKTHTLKKIQFQKLETRRTYTHNQKASAHLNY